MMFKASFKLEGTIYANNQAANTYSNNATETCYFFGATDSMWDNISWSHRLNVTYVQLYFARKMRSFTAVFQRNSIYNYRSLKPTEHSNIAMADNSGKKDLD